MLAKALHTLPDHTSAFRQYEQLVRPYVEQRQKNARTLTKSFLPESSLRLIIQHMMIKFLLRDIFSGLLRQQFGTESLLASQSTHQSDEPLLE